MANIDKLKSIATNDSNWLSEAEDRQKNKAWLKHSQKIAIKVLRTLREKKIKQTELASLMGVSAQQVNKIVKGKENLTLETISKLEQALEINLVSIEFNTHSITKDYIIKKVKVDWHIYTKRAKVAKQKTPYKINEQVYSQSEINENCVNYG